MTLEQLREALTPKPWPSKTARTGPLSALRKAGRLDRGAYPYWADHQYTGTDPNTGARMYGASPYQLAEADLADLAFLAGEGWGVSVHAHSVYGLGTVQVVLREPGR